MLILIGELKKLGLQTLRKHEFKWYAIPPPLIVRVNYLNNIHIYCGFCHWHVSLTIFK